jgi:hypothetical protein
VAAPLIYDTVKDEADHIKEQSKK